MPDGILIDLRPLAASWPVEVVSRRERQLAGRLTDSEAALNDDAAANQAAEGAAQDGWYRREREQTFPFYYYWDSPKQMQEFLEEEWADLGNLNEDVWRRIRSIWAVADADARLRIQVDILITRWRRLP